MILTITTTHAPATDLGYLLHKNPGRVHSKEMTFGWVHVFYPEASEERCSASLLLEVDPVGLVRDRRGPQGEGGVLTQYVNDRPYAACSFLSSAIAEMYGTAMTGRSKERPELAEQPLPLEAHLPTLPCRGGEEVLRRLFEPLGYEVEAVPVPLDESFPEWGASPYFSVRLRQTILLKDLLNHLVVLIPVLDNDKHYWVDRDEVDKLLRRGRGWLVTHPNRREIIRRFLRHRAQLTRLALARMTEEEASGDPDAVEEEHRNQEEAVERKLSLHEQRLTAVHQAIKDSGAHRVVDLGCGEGRLLELLLKDKAFSEVVGVDVSYHVLERAQRRLRLERYPRLAEKLKLLQGSLVYRDRRIEGYDAAAVVEVIEHLDANRLQTFERVLFGLARPTTVVLTTPNREYNVLFETLPAGKMRHRDHRFEWTRAEFQGWAEAVAAKHGYTVRHEPIGPVDETHGAPSQMAVFTRS